MEQIKSLSLTALLVGSHAEFHTSVLSLITATTPEVLFIKVFFSDYQREVEKLLSLVNKSNRLPQTKELKEADNGRDAYLRRLFKSVKDLMKSPSSDEKEAAEKIWNVIVSYKGIMENEINKETAQIRGLFRDLETEELEAALKYVFLDDIIGRMKTYNDIVVEEMDKRVKLESKKQKIDTAEQRKIVNDLYASIVRQVNAFAIAMPSEEVDEFILSLNSLIDEYKRVISHMQPGGTGNEKVNKKSDE